MNADATPTWTLGRLLARQARAYGDRTLVKTREGSISFAGCDREASRVAHGLHALGVGRGDVVLTMLPNSTEFVVTWFGAGRAGAMTAPVNTSFRGPGLSRMINLTEGAVLVVAEEFLEPLAFVTDSLTHVRTLVVLGDVPSARAQFPSMDVHAFHDLLGPVDPGPPRPEWAEVGEADSFTLLFTSGTTGTSKACELSHYACLRQADLFAQGMTLRGDDVLFCPFPIFHEDAPLWTVLPALLLGATAALSRRFSVSRFWDEIREFDATVFDFMGATLTMLWKQPPCADDRENPARLAWGIPMPDFAGAFRERFGLDAILDAYGLTEAGVCVFNDPARPAPRGSCGRAIPSYDVRIVDETGREVPPGVVGESVIRPMEPNLVMKGYFRMPEATLEMYRDLWLHTGDYAAIDENGFFYFKSRKKDALRVRGENVSAFEVEEVVDSHEKVLESAAIAVPSDLTEDEVKICVVLRPGEKLSPEELVSFCAQRMSKHMVPRYVEFLDALPKTPTEKVAKYVLEQAGVTAATWDRQTVEPPRRASVALGGGA